MDKTIQAFGFRVAHYAEILFQLQLTGVILKITFNLIWN